MEAQRPPKLTQAAQERRAKSELHDQQFFLDRKAAEVANLAKTRALRAQRLAKEAQDRAATPSIVKSK